MPHLRSQGPPPELSLPLRSDSRDFSEGSTSEVSASTPVSAEFSDHTPPFSSSSSTHSSPHFHFIPPMAERRTVHQQATAGFTGLNNPITVPNITNENSILSRYATGTQTGKTPFDSSPNPFLPHNTPLIHSGDPLIRIHHHHSLTLLRRFRPPPSTYPLSIHSGDHFTTTTTLPLLPPYLSPPIATFDHPLLITIINHHQTLRLSPLSKPQQHFLFVSTTTPATTAITTAGNHHDSPFLGWGNKEQEFSSLLLSFTCFPVAFEVMWHSNFIFRALDLFLAIFSLV
ncbi:hypothetical protein E3N88_15128 [Mikania micrantha]|uniref:Uncharacterized protein n=1 Tax=Mikania micrantha TaxID=192012 RepID=A0A5N6NW03_9ASTR|nr:hypothetical protein E3N88_15128 [Mikania micrantha]